MTWTIRNSILFGLLFVIGLFWAMSNVANLETPDWLRKPDWPVSQWWSNVIGFFEISNLFSLLLALLAVSLILTVTAASWRGTRSIVFGLMATKTAIIGLILIYHFLPINLITTGATEPVSAIWHWIRENSTEIATYCVYSILALLVVSWFTPAKLVNIIYSIQAVLAVLLFVALSQTAFFQGIINSAVESNRCTEAGNCVKHTAQACDHNNGYLQPITLHPGEESVAICNWKGRYLRWDIVSGKQMPKVHSRIGDNGKWLNYCDPKAWDIKFVMPHNATESVTILVQRRTGSLEKEEGFESCS